jgi:DNA end-binding protein Ku
MRPIWKGSISFGLVNIPVALYSATRAANEVKMHMLRESDHSPIRFKRVAEADGREVSWDQIVKGYEYEKGKHVVLTEKDFEQVNVKSNQTVDIQEFVELSEIDPMFFDQPYFLAPEKGGEKAYGVLRDALKRSDRAGIAKVTLKTREHLAAVKPLGDALVLELMHFPEELARPDDLPLPKQKEVGKREVEMAESLINGMTEKWDPGKYQDEYREALLKLIQQKIHSKGKKVSDSRRRAAQPTNIVDLAAVLQESLRQTKPGKRSKAPKKARRKAA